MPTQTEIGDHLDLSQAEVSKLMAALEIDWREADIADIRVAYIRRLRGVAAGHKTSDGQDLTRERVLTEQIDREMKQLALAEKRGQLVNVEQLEPMLQQMVGAFKTELTQRDDKLRAEIEALYGIDLDPALLEDHTRATLKQLARYDPGQLGAGAPPGEGDRAHAEDEHDGVGEGTPLHVGEKHVQAG